MIEDQTWDKDNLDLDPGDVLLLYTDGVTEAQNLQGEQYGTDRLIDTAKKSLALPAKDIQTAVIKDVDEFIGDASQLDDITLVIVVRD